MTARIESLEKTPDTQEAASSQSELTASLITPRNWADRWADHMSEVGDTPMYMYTDPTWEDLNEDEEEDGQRGTKLFVVSQENEEFLKRHFSCRSENSTRCQWREKHRAPKLSATACPKLDKLMKQSLSAHTKSKDRQLSKSQALVLDAVGPLNWPLF